MRFHAPDITGAHFDTRQRRADPGKWGFHAHARIRCAADHLVRVRAVRHGADKKTVGVGMGCDFQYFPHHDTCERLGRIGRAVDFEPGPGELFAKGLGIDFRIDPFT